MKNKILGLMLVFVISPEIMASQFIQPIIQGKIYSDLDIPIKSLGEPRKVIKGQYDECNGDYFPDEYSYGTFTVLETGVIKEVYLNQGNELLFHGQKVQAGMDQKRFMQQFKKYNLWTNSENKNVVYSRLFEDGNDSIEFIFKNRKLLKYKLFFDDC